MSNDQAATGYFFSVSGNTINWQDNNPVTPRKAEKMISRLVEK
jgi:hypothetical protein